MGIREAAAFWLAKTTQTFRSKARFILRKNRFNMRQQWPIYTFMSQVQRSCTWWANAPFCDRSFPCRNACESWVWLNSCDEPLQQLATGFSPVAMHVKVESGSTLAMSRCDSLRLGFPLSPCMWKLSLAQLLQWAVATACDWVSPCRNACYMLGAIFLSIDRA